MARILVALSGGVDSAVAAMLLAREGHSVHGLYMKNWIYEDQVLGDCPWQQDIEDAGAVARRIGISFCVVNFIREYRERVVRYLVEGYQQGITPNPDVMCNREMKFGVLLQWAREEGFEAVATGHYCRRLTDTSGQARLHEGVDPDKDQSYFLCLIRADQLRQAEFPLGGLHKSEVRELARRGGLPVAEKKDSQGICFVGRVRMSDFLEQFIPDSPGEIVDLEGRVLGMHRGLHRFTLGQRRGIGIPSNTDHENYVVVEKDLPLNRLVVAFDQPGTPGLFQDSMLVSSLNWLAPPPLEGESLEVRARYRDPRVRARFHWVAADLARVEFEHRQRALAPGQVAALHRGTEVIGGGVFAGSGEGAAHLPSP